MKHGMVKRLTAVFTAFLFSLGMVWYLPGEELEKLDIFAVRVSADSSGTCGDNLTWSLSDDGVLTISGTGEMYNFTYYTVPWYSQKSNIKSVNIVNEVTSIGDYAFSECQNIYSIDIPKSMTVIGKYSFWGCSSLSSIIIPDSVIKIDDNAFYECKALTDISIPDSVTSLGKAVFYNCFNLKSVKLPDNLTVLPPSFFGACFRLESIDLPNTLTTIGNSAFGACEKLLNINIPENVTEIGGDAFSGCHGLKSIVIPDSVESIKAGTFHYCWGLISVSLPVNLKYIGKQAFCECKSLISLDIPDMVTSIEDDAFICCGNLKEINVDLDNNSYSSIDGVLIDKKRNSIFQYPCGNEAHTYDIPNNVVSINDYAFYDCKSLESVNISNNVKSIGTCAFENCTSLTSITIPNSVTQIGDEAFRYCTDLKSVNILGGVTSIGYAVFCNCTSLKSLNISDSVTSIESSAFYECSLTHIHIPNGKTASDYKGKGSLPNNDEYYFPLDKNGHCSDPDCPMGLYFDPKKCGKCGSSGSNLVWEYSNGTLTITGSGDMYSYWYLEDSTPWKEYADEINTVVLDSRITSIGSGAFDKCSNLSEITIPDGVKSIGAFAFRDAGLTSLNIPDSVTSIGTGAFENLKRITSINIPNSWTSIQNYAFYGCTNLKSVNIPNSVTSIGFYAFCNCTNLKSVNIPDSVTSIENGAFLCCKSLISVNIPAGVKHKMGIDTFGYCTSITHIHIPNGKTASDYRLMSGGLPEESSYYFPLDENGHCSDPDCPMGLYFDPNKCGDNLVWEYSNGTLTITGSGDMFDWETEDDVPWKEYANEIKTVVLDSRITSIGACAFYECGNLSEIVIPDGVTSIGGSAFFYCGSLSDIKIPDSVNYIHDCAFFYCTSLKSVIIPNGVKSIGHETFQGCANLESVSISESVTEINRSAFTGCDSLKHIHIPNGKTANDYKGRGSLPNNDEYYFPLDENGHCSDPDCPMGLYFDPKKCGDNLVWEYSNGTLIITGSGDMFNWDYAMYVPWREYSNDITTVNLDPAVTSIGDIAFANCTKLTDIQLGDCSGLTYIGNSAFANCKKLKSVALCDKVTTIRKNAFDFCTSLKEVWFFGNKPTIGENAFRGCKNGIYFHFPVDNSTWTDELPKFDDLEVRWSAFDPVSGKGSVPCFDESKDAWGFLNSDDNYGSTYKIFYSDYERLVSDLYAVEKDRITYDDGSNFYDYYDKSVKGKKSSWHGSCHGMSVLSALMAKGVLFGDVHNITNPSQNVLSMINYYHRQQNLAVAVYGCMADYFYQGNNHYKLNTLENLAKNADLNNEAIVLGYDNHTVVAYGFETGKWNYSTSGKNVTYDRRILIYDCSHETSTVSNHNFDLYYTYDDDGKASYCVPGWGMYNNSVSSKVGTIGFLKFVKPTMNFIDYETGKVNSKTNNTYVLLEYLSENRYVGDDGDFNVKIYCRYGDKFCSIDGDMYMIDDNSEIKKAYTYSDIEESNNGYHKATIALPESNEYTITSENNINYRITTDKYAFSGSSDCGGTMVIDTEKGCVELKPDSKSDCYIRLTANDGYSSTAYPMTEIMTKNSESLKAEFTPDGIEISGDDLTNLDIICGDFIDFTEKTISSDYDTIMLKTEGSENEISLYADTDGDGSFETKLEESTEEHQHTPSSAWTSDATGHWHTCSGCDVKVDFAEHTYDSGTVTKAATETKNGEKTYKCTVCGHEKKETIPKAGIIPTHVEEPTPVQETIPAEEIIPAQETHPVGEITPSQEPIPVTETIPVQETIFMTETTTVTETSPASVPVSVQPESSELRVYSENTEYYVNYPENAPNTASSTIYPTVTYNNTTDNMTAFPEAVTGGISASVSADGKVTLEWSAVPDASGYAVYVDKNGEYSKLRETSGTKIILKGMKNSRTYKFLVRYIIGGKLSDIGDSYTVSVYVYYKPQVSAAASSGSVALKWKKVPDAEKYAVYKYVNGKPVKVKEIKGNSIKFSGLKAGKEYSYIVRACIGGKLTSGTKSDIVTVTVPADSSN